LILKKKIVRLFKGHDALITDISFSGDARWLASADSVSIVRIWDLPSGRCIDWFKTEKPVTSMDFSPRSDFLATSHVGSNGIYLWANSFYFSDVFLKPIPDVPSLISLPTISGNVSEDNENPKDMDENELWGELEIKESLSEELITLSRLSKSKWKTLVNLDIINERNKPEKPPDTQKLAPFILPTMAGLEPRFTSLNEENNIFEGGSKIINIGKSGIQSKFLKVVKDDMQKGDFLETMNQLKSMSPSAIDFEIRALGYDNNFEDITLILKFIKIHLTKKQNFDIIQAFLAIFLKVHMEMIPNSEELINLCSEIEEIQTKTWVEINDTMNNTLCLLSFFTNTFDQL